MSRTTDFGERSDSRTHGWVSRYTRSACSQRLVQRLGVGDLLEQLHPLLVLDALGLHLGDRLAARLVGLGHQHRERVVEDRLDDRQRRRGVGLGLGVEQLERDEREGRQRLVEREVLLQLDGSRSVRPSASGSASHSRTPASSSSVAAAPRPARRGARRPRSSSWLSSISARIVATGSRRLVDDVEDHRVVDAHPRDERLGRRVARGARTSPRSSSPRRPAACGPGPCGASWGRRRPWPARASARSRARAPARRRSRDVSKPARPARPAIWWNSRALSSRWRVPSNFARPVKTTVRIGTLMPTPSVSVPQMTFSRPVCASCSTSRR